MSHGKFIIAGLGEILWDILPEGKKLGGAPANFAFHAGQLGGESYVVSAVGADALGEEIRAKIISLGLEEDYIAVAKDRPTGTVDVELDSQGKPNYVIHENVAWDHIPWNENLSALAEKTDAICFGSLCQRSEMSRKTVRSFLKDATDSCLRVFDINLRQSYYSSEIIIESLNLANALKLNDEELPILAEMLGLTGKHEDIIKKIISRYGLQWLVVTSGSSGSVITTGDETIECAGYPVNVADTVGAGDSYTAATVIGWLKGMELSRINDLACRVAAFVCSRSGATPKLPDELIAEFTTFSLPSCSEGQQ